uniref:GRB2-associated-binding protein 1-like n=1 Tax=Pundamilia nyererei TaxID=303518 RepID=A0A3B4ETG5_9CICH
MSGAGDVVCEGWLRKSPPEKKLRRYAWKRRWFVLRSGRLSGEPDVLQYYKNPHSRRPIRNINLNLCEQVDAGLSFTKKELESSFVFDLRTEERIWYLVAESEEDMNRWVTSICLLCGFNPTDDVSHTTTISTMTGLVPPPYDPVSVRVPPPSDPSAQLQEGNYVPMTPLTSSFPTHPTTVPPPAHMGFRNSALTPLAPLTPPLRRNTMNTSAGGEQEAVPPPIHRNLKPQRRVKPAPLDISSVQQDWQEVPPPVRSPVTRTFTRGPSSRRTVTPSSAHSSSPSSDSDDPDDNYVAMMTSSLKGGVSSPVLRRARDDKQVEYLDLDLHTGQSTPSRQKRCTGEGQRTRVDYAVVDPKRTKALRSTREARHAGRMSTEKNKL